LQARRRGTVAALVAVLLMALMGFAALALDGGLMQDNRRRVQAATDAAALAAATQLYRDSASIAQNNPDPGGNAATAARANAATNGYANDGTNSVVTVNIPPKSGPFTGKTGYAEVYITYNQPRYFSTILGSNRLPVVARAVALGRWGGTGNGIIVLD